MKDTLERKVVEYLPLDFGLFHFLVSGFLSAYNAGRSGQMEAEGASMLSDFLFYITFVVGMALAKAGDEFTEQYQKQKGIAGNRTAIVTAVKTFFKYLPLWAVLGIIPLSMSLGSHWFLPLLDQVLGLYGTRVFICVVIISLGIGAHWWKRKSQYTYGMGEFIFGVAATVFITFQITPGQSVLSQWVGLGGAAYVIARGLNNRNEAPGKNTSRV